MNMKIDWSRFSPDRDKVKTEAELERERELEEDIADIRELSRLDREADLERWKE